MAKSFNYISSSAFETFDDVLEELGFGKFQLLVLILLISLEIPCAFVSFIPVFIGAAPKLSEWRCNDFPVSDPLDICNCNGTLTAPKHSIVAEWNLVCEKAWLTDFMTSLQMLGMLFGNLFGAQISDWYGRKYTSFASTLLMALGSTVSAFVTNPYLYFASRFISGTGFAGLMSILVIYTIEFMPAKYRSICGSVGPWGEAEVLLAVIAYFFKDWQTMTLITTAPIFLLLIIIFPLVPESPRWLMNNNKVDEAYSVVERMSSMNGRSIPIVDKSTLQRIASKNVVHVQSSSGNERVKRSSYLDFFVSKELRLITISLMLIWFSWTMVYFGITYNIKNVPGNPYFNFAIMGLVDSAGFKSSLFIINRIGRRVSLVCSMSLGAFFLVLLAILMLTMETSEYPILVLVICLLGKFGMAVARSCARTLTGESFPTAMRTMGVGMCGISASLGGVLCPFLVYLGTTQPAIPFFGFAIISLCGSLFSLLVPETNGKPLAENIIRKLSRRISEIILPGSITTVIINNGESRDDKVNSLA